MQSSTGGGAAARLVQSFPLRDVLKVLPERLQTLLQPLPSDAELDGPRITARDALRYLTSQQPAERLGDYLDFGADARASARATARVLRELRLDDVRTLAFDASVTPALREKYRLRKASVVRIGRGAQTADVLRSVGPLIVDLTVVLIDQSDQVELDTFLQAHPGLTASPLPCDSGSQLGFVVRRALTV